MLNIGADAAPHRALISTPVNRAVALRVKSTGRPVFGTENVAVTGANVPIGKAGMFTVAFVALTNEKPCSPDQS